MDEAKRDEIRQWLIKAKRDLGSARRLITGEETPYATAFRYPGDIVEPTLEDAREAVVLAERVLDFVIQKMPEETKPV